MLCAIQPLVKSFDFATSSNCGKLLKTMILNYMGNRVMAESKTRV
ncbi:hypothetical protein PBCV1_A122/123cL [Paramecium bursaria Chlorella virus 1]|uniref:Uncharacterized protein n=1 Tax=Paramecium bursaria Chlorella virus 1 TaxID=10506 RepID=F8TTY2_PBCV1|nr:hypothetical protein PBCV1_A122/123cL [Paramecium bursaria Chlorella virus 1]AEI70043.1 hypothetical protein [Paramecium bursaria Chlorella virus 1]